jgi:hypothetical protein
VDVRRIAVRAPRYNGTDLKIAFAIREETWFGSDPTKNATNRTYQNVRRTANSGLVVWNSKVTAAATEAVSFDWPPFPLNRSPTATASGVHGPAIAIGYAPLSTSAVVAAGTYTFEFELECVATGRGVWTD